MTNRIDLYRQVLTGEATPEEQESFDQLMNQPELLKEFGEYEAIWKNAVRLPRKKSFNDVMAFARVDKLVELRKTQRRKYLFAASTGLAAGILIVLGLFAVTKMIFGHESAPVIVKTDTGNRTTMTLPDGSEVCLNSSSTISYDDHFNDKQRRVVLNGEAYFEVTKSKVPFIVEAKDLEIKVHGTEFNVSAYADDDVIRASLESGKISVQKKGDPTEYFLNVGQMLEYKDNRMEIKEVEVEEYSAWKSNKLYLHDESLRNIANWLERQYGYHFTIKPESLGEEVHISGSFDNNSLEEILDAVTLASGVAVKQEKDGYLIYK